MQPSFLSQILDAKEKLHSLKINCTKTTQKQVVSVGLNIPGVPKTTPLIRKFFFSVLEEFFVFAQANRVSINKDLQRVCDTEAGLTYYSSVDRNQTDEELKRITETFETSHPLGRFIDIDVMAKSGENISSGKEKACFVCENKTAIECRRNQTHSTTELRNFQSAQIKKYLVEQHRTVQAQLMTELAVYALIEEASLHPKPGLVTPKCNGAHADMDFGTFTRSISALAPIFATFFNHSLSSNKTLTISELRTFGLQAEQRMFAATGNINTHKGAIFVLLLLGEAIANLIKLNLPLNNQNIGQQLSRWSNSIANDPMVYTEKTHGNKVMHKHPDAGIRAQAASGFPCIFDNGLIPLQQFYFSPQNTTHRKEWILQLSLLSIMAANQDSNVIHRGGMEQLKTMQQMAKKAYKKLLINNTEPYNKLNDWCLLHNISPGGSADLLSASIFTYLCQINPKFAPYEL